MAAYTPSRVVPIPGLILLLVFSIVGGLAVGVLLFASSLLIYLILVSAGLAAALGGALLVLAVRWGKVRNPLVAMFFGLVMGILIYGTYRYAEYLHTVYTVTRDESPAEVDAFLEQETGLAGFPGFVVFVFREGNIFDGWWEFTRFQAEEGMRITRATSTSDTGGFTLGKELTYGYWIIEILMMIGFPVGMARNAARARFCEDTGQWLKYRTLGKIDRDAIQTFLGQVQAGDFRQAGAHLTTGKVTSPYLEVQTARCAEDAQDILLKITQVNGNKRNELLVSTLTPVQYDDVAQAGGRVVWQ